MQNIAENGVLKSFMKFTIVGPVRFQDALQKEHEVVSFTFPRAQIILCTAIDFAAETVALTDVTYLIAYDGMPRKDLCSGLPVMHH